MKSSPLALRLVLIGCVGTGSALAHAQGVSPEAVPGRDESALPPTASGTSTPTGATSVQTSGVSSVDGSPATAPFAQGASRLTAARVAYEGGTIIAQGDENSPAVFQSALGRLEARELRLDTLAQTVEGKGQVRLERETQAERRELRSNRLERLSRREFTTQSFQGQNLRFDFKTRRGTLDGAVLRSDVDLRADRLEINGERYTARGVVVRPGGLSDEELKIYGTPPLSLRAREVNVLRDPRSGKFSISARSAGLYFGKTRLLPLPSALLRRGSGNNSDFRITPGISFNSTDRFLITTRIGFPLAADPRQLALDVNLGLSQRIGFRGGATLSSTQKFGDVRLTAQRRDIVTTQLTNRLEVDRKPELSFQSPAFATFSRRGLGRAGFSVDGSYGNFTERSTDQDNGSGSISSNRLQARLLFSTRLDPRNGPFLRAFASTAHYPRASTSYDSTGVELGFAGRLGRRVNGEVSLRLTSVQGQTPFRFDLIEIPRELRTTFDVELTPRYLLPFDLRYDLNQSKVRDASFGLLRSYKVFAYGVVYQTTRRDLRLELRSAF